MSMGYLLKVIDEDATKLLRSLDLRLAVHLTYQQASYLGNLVSPLPIAINLSCWIEEWGLTEEAAIRILESLRSPRALAGCRFASDLMALLGSAVAVELDQMDKVRGIVVARSKHAADAAAAAESPPTPEQREQLADAKRTIGVIPEEKRNG